VNSEVYLLSMSGVNAIRHVNT